jgi:hypothetical protein
MLASGAAPVIVIHLQSEGCKFGSMQVGTFAPGNAVCSICINIQLAVFIFLFLGLWFSFRRF